MAAHLTPTATLPALRSGSTVGGRFKLDRVLGVGAQATVWLGHDERLQRDVAVKLLRVEPGADAAALGEWLAEARSVSRLSHPHIVPVFDAAVHDGQPCLVYEYVAGRTLAQHVATRGALPPHEAVAMLVGVLDALQTAHAAGVVHRDLKPSNILLAADGRARVMDFGIAARLQDDPGHTVQRDIVGTPGYLSPEAAAGSAPSASMDVFAAGLVLIELLSGRRLVQERDPYRALDRVLQHDLVLPADLTSEVDDALRATLQRAIERDADRRWPTAAAFRDALQRWLAPVPGDTSDPGGERNATVDFLLRRMRHKSDFPALSDAVVRIQRVADSDVDSIADLSSEILKDVALTNKLLRVVNTADYSRPGEGGQISTVSRAVALIGFQGVRNMALSLVLLDRMHDKAHARQLEETFLRALMAGMLASEIGVGLRDTEEVFLGAMFQNLGRLLAEFYFPEEARHIRGIVAGSARTAAAPLGEDAAALSVLGLTFDALGLGVARAWGLPERLQACMRKPTGDPPPRTGDMADRLRWLTGLANRITDTFLHHEPATAGVRVAELAVQHQRAIGVDAERIQLAAAATQRRLASMVGAMNLQIAPSSKAARLLGSAGTAPAAAPAPDDVLATHTLQATRTLRLPHDAVPADAADLLAAGIQDVTTTLLDEHCALNDVLHMIVETMHRALGFRRVVFCLRDAKTGSLTGRFGMGEGAAEVAALFNVPLAGGSDLFGIVCAKGADTLIADATVPAMAARLPAWYRSHVAAPAFLLLPLLLKGAPFALIYADKATPGGLSLGDKELSLLRTLRNQAVMAFRQSC